MESRPPEDLLEDADAITEIVSAENAAHDGGDVVWQQPLDILADCELSAPPKLDRHHLPDAITPFVFDTAERMGVDPATVALAALVALASAASEEWSLQPKRYDNTWTENPRLWGVIVGPPSILKSPVIRAATRPLDRLEIEARERFVEEHRTWKAEVARLKDQKVLPCPAPRWDRYLAEGTTVEALSQLFRDDDDARYRLPTGKILIRQDELSELIASMDQYKAGGRGGADRGAYLRLFNGGRYVVDRVGRGSFAIKNWSACILGGVQPEPVQRIARDAADDGLLQRFLFVVPASPRSGQDRRPDEAAIRRYHTLFATLSGLYPPRSPDGGVGPVVLHDRAHLHKDELFSQLKALAAMPDTSTRLQSALEKWQGIFARTVLVFHLIEIADARGQGRVPPPMQVVSEATVKRAASCLRDVLLPHLLRADSLLFQTVQTGHAKWIAGFILASDEARDGGFVTARSLQRAYGPLRGPEHRRTLVDVMASLETMGWVRAELHDNPPRPITRWEVSPLLHSAFAQRAEDERRRRDASRAAIAEAIKASRQRA